MKGTVEKNILNKVVDLIKKNKAQGDVIFSKTNTFNLKAHMGEMDKYEVSDTGVIGVRVIKDNKIGLSFSEALDDDSLNFMVKEAVSNALFSKENLYEKISTKKNEIIDDGIEEKEAVDPKLMIDLCLKNENFIREKDTRVKNSPYNGVKEITSQFFLLNTNDTYCERKDKYYMIVASALMEEGKKNSSFYEFCTTKKFSELEYKKINEECLEHSKNILDAKEIPSGRYNVVFTNRTLNEIFSVYMGIFSGEQTVKGLNPLKDKLGKNIALDQLTIIDSPRFKDAYYKYSFDEEGNSTDDIILLENGVMKNFIHNSATANELKMDNNFRASRSPKSTLGVSNSNIVIKEGKTSESDIEKFDHLEIIEMQGMHSGSNFFSGEFSCAVKGYLWENGKRKGTFKNVTMSGNFYNMLQNIEAIGDKCYPNPSYSFFAPKIVFKGLSISGT